MAAADVEGPPRKKARKSTQSEDGAAKRTLEEAQAAVEKQQQKDIRKKAVKYNRGPQTKLKVRLSNPSDTVAGFWMALRHRLSVQSNLVRSIPWQGVVI
jgi:hypothetical protein